jgi:integrase
VRATKNRKSVVLDSDIVRVQDCDKPKSRCSRLGPHRCPLCQDAPILLVATGIRSVVCLGVRSATLDGYDGRRLLLRGGGRARVVRFFHCNHNGLMELLGGGHSHISPAPPPHTVTVVDKRECRFEVPLSWLKE